MFQTLFYLGLAVAAIVAAFGAYIAVIGVVQANSKRTSGWVFLAPYFIFLTVALFTLAGGRDLTQGVWALVTTSGYTGAAWPSWVQRLLTVLILLAAAERIASAVFRNNERKRLSWPLFLFVAYWCCVVASPSVLGRYPQFSYDYVYPLVIGTAVCLLSRDECQDYLMACRNAALVFVVAGVALVPLNLGLVLETNYAQGFIPGLPRMAGLSPHALQLGLIVQIAMLCLWARPLPAVWLNRAAWLVCLLVLVLAQSKTAWVSFALCTCVMMASRRGKGFKSLVFNPLRPASGVLLIVVAMLGLMAVAYAIAFSQIGAHVLGFFETKEGATLLTFNGRDQIWEVAFAEWARSPLFGYGPGLLNFDHRASLGMLNATHAHNQFVDDLARAGLVGATGLIVYALALLLLCVRTSAASGGLSLALFLMLFIRAISEVPLNMYGYGVDFVAHALLIAVVVGASKGDFNTPKQI